MSRSLGIETVAEGIETSEQAERMRRLGCAFGQGYAFARPMDEADLLAGFGTVEAQPAARAKAARTAAADAANASRRAVTKASPAPRATRRPAGA